MPANDLIPVFDGHNDTLTHIHNADASNARSFLERSDLGCIDLPRAREGGLVGGFFAIFTSSPGWEMELKPLIGEDGEVVPEGWADQSSAVDPTDAEPVPDFVFDQSLPDAFED